MSIGCSAIGLLTLVTVFSTVTASSNVVASHYIPGCKGGRRFRSTCYKLGDMVMGYRSYRNCDLVTIKDDEENEFVKQLINEAGVEYAWIHKGDGLYNNFDNMQRGDCFDMDQQGTWTANTYCRVRQRPVCVWKPDCEVGWIGESCNEQCHCYQENCTRYQDTCHYGCQPGWTGQNCSKDTTTPIVEHYCVKYRTHYALLLSKNENSPDTGSLVPLDQEGYPMNPDQYTEGFNGSDVLEISTSDLSLPFKPNYHERKIDDTFGMTFEWDLRYRQQNGLWMQSDLDFRVRCNFSEVDEMFGTTSLQFEKTSFGKTSTTSPLPTEVDVELVFTDPKKGGFLTNISIGQPVKVVMKQNYTNEKLPGEDSQDKPLSLLPRSCFARSPDNKMVKQITDDSGCKLQADYFGWNEASKTGDFVTFPFAAFGVSGYSSLNISCDLVICFEEGNEVGHCRRPCRYRN